MTIVIDTNIVFSGILNPSSNIGKILILPGEQFQFYTCGYLWVEIKKHRNRLLSLTKLSEEKLNELENLVVKNVKFIDDTLLPQEILVKAELLLNDVDPNDTPFVALTMHLEGKLWTGDLQLYNGLRAKHFTNVVLTSELFLLLSGMP